MLPLNKRLSYNIYQSKFMKLLLFLFSFASFSLFAQEKIQKTDAQWKKELTKEQYYILREKGTEYAFSGQYNKHYKKGIYVCAACNTPLFRSNTKFNSGTGWPSFDNHIDKNIRFLNDSKYGITRTEIVCAICNGHLGHIFLDGPKETTGKRYCVNSLSLSFKESE